MVKMMQLIQLHVFIPGEPVPRGTRRPPPGIKKTECSWISCIIWRMGKLCSWINCIISISFIMNHMAAGHLFSALWVCATAKFSESKTSQKSQCQSQSQSQSLPSPKNNLGGPPGAARPRPPRNEKKNNTSSYSPPSKITRFLFRAKRGEQICWSLYYR